MGKHELIFHHALNVQSKTNTVPEAWFLGTDWRETSQSANHTLNQQKFQLILFPQMSPLENYWVPLCFIKWPTTKEKNNFFKMELDMWKKGMECPLSRVLFMKGNILGFGKSTWNDLKWHTSKCQKCIFTSESCFSEPGCL